MINPKLLSTHLFIGNCLITLTGKKRMLRLVEVFLQHKDGIYHEDLRTIMFGQPTKNIRVLKAQDVSLRRLITRFRTLIRTSLEGSEMANFAQWLVYSGRDDKWWFFEPVK